MALLKKFQKMKNKKNNHGEKIVFYNSNPIAS